MRTLSLKTWRAQPGYLVICNSGEDLTFITAVRKEVLDLTLASSSLMYRVSDWRVLSAHSSSNHSSSNFPWMKPNRFRKLRCMDWDLYSRNLQDFLPEAPQRNANISEESIDELVETFTAAWNRTLKSFCPLRPSPKKEKPPWWTTRLTEIRISCRRLFNGARRIKSRSGWELYNGMSHSRRPSEFNEEHLN